MILLASSLGWVYGCFFCCTCMGLLTQLQSPGNSTGSVCSKMDSLTCLVISAWPQVLDRLVYFYMIVEVFRKRKSRNCKVFWHTAQKPKKKKKKEEASATFYRQSRFARPDSMTRKNRLDLLKGRIVDPYFKGYVYRVGRITIAILTNR